MRGGSKSQTGLFEKYIDGNTSIFDCMHLQREQVFVQVHFTSRWNTSLPSCGKAQIGSRLPIPSSSAIHYSGVTSRVRGVLTAPSDAIRRGDTIMKKLINSLITANVCRRVKGDHSMVTKHLNVHF